MEIKPRTVKSAVVVFLLLMAFPLVSYSQIWSEDFSYASGTTVGTGNTDALKKFMSDLCGISKDQIEVISGQREKIK